MLYQGNQRPGTMAQYYDSVTRGLADIVGSCKTESPSLHKTEPPSCVKAEPQGILKAERPGPPDDTAAALRWSWKSSEAMTPYQAEQVLLCCAGGEWALCSGAMFCRV